MKTVVGALFIVGIMFWCSGCASSEVGDPPTEDAVATSTSTSIDAPDPTDSQPTTAEATPISSTGADELRDLIRPGDPASSYCLADLGVGPGEFYDKGTDQLLFPEQTYFFEARYDDGSVVEIRIHPDLVGSTTATDQAERIAGPISLLPVELRQGITRVGFLDGDSTAQGDGGGEGIHVYAGNVAVREAASRFEETMFHESVHTSLDDDYAASAQWLAAQEADGAFLTEYAASYPETEDLAETSLYAWALLHHPDRVSEADAAAWRAMVPERIAVVENILSAPGTGYTPTTPTC